MIAIIVGIGGLAITGIQINVVPMMTDAGLPAAEAALLLTVLGIASLLGRFIGGLLLDRVPARFVAAGCCCARWSGSSCSSPSSRSPRQG